MVSVLSIANNALQWQVNMKTADPSNILQAGEQS